MEEAEEDGGWRLVLGTLFRLENVVSVDRPGSPARPEGRDTPNMGGAELLTTGDTGTAGLEAGACHGEARDAVGVVRSDSRIPLMPRLRGGRVFGDSFRELGLLSKASVEKGDILDVSERGVTLLAAFAVVVVRSRLESVSARGVLRLSAPTAE